MVRLSSVIAVALLAFAPMATAQDVQQTDSPEPVAAPEPRVAVPRSEARPPQPPPAAQPAAPATQGREQAQPRPRGGSAPTTINVDDQRRAEPRGSRPRGDNPPTGVAVPRTTRRVPPPTTVIRPEPRIYNNYYYYPRRSYPYGYGAFGLGYFYYNPYGWHRDPYYSNYGYYGGYPRYGGYGGVWRGYGYGYPTGELRLRVTGPRDAHVLVDGYYAGVLDDFDGIVQGLTLEEGPYQIQVVAPGYEPLTFDVRILPGRKITYRGAMRRQP